MAGRLVVEEGYLKGMSLPLEDGDNTWTIGRDPDECQFIIQDPLVSRRHLLVRRFPEGIIVENLSETNPSQVNDKEIDDQPMVLHDNDAIRIGSEVLRYYEDFTEEEPSFVEEIEETEEPKDLEMAEKRETEESEGVLENLKAYIQKAENPTAVEEPSAEASETAEDLQQAYEEEESSDLGSLAEIDFGVVEAGRWLLKVIGGPNNGAEFHMQAGNSYVLGTDPHLCDIVFHDTSVSRQHARIIVTPEDTLLIEDLKSRNGILINGALIEGKQPLSLSTIVTLGTTSFVVYDREGEMNTIISPLLPSIVKVLQQEAAPVTVPPPMEPIQSKPAPEAAPLPAAEQPKPAKSFGPYILLSAIIGLFILAGIGTTALFQTEPVVVQAHVNADELIQEALKPYPAIRYTYNKASGGLLLLGHVTTTADKEQLLYHLQNLKFIKSVDSSGIIIDDFVWQEVNSILSRTPAWKGISIYSPAAGQFILSGYLQTRKEAEQLSSYISLNFPYLDLLKKQIVVEEDVINQVNVLLRDKQLNEVIPAMVKGEVTLTGTMPTEQPDVLNDIIDKIKQIPGVRMVNNQVRIHTAETGTTNITESYPVTGKSRLGNQFTVVINGRILSENDDLDGMTIMKITSNRILLEKDGNKYRIDY